MQIKDRRFVVTGAASGIGYAVVLELLRRGAYVAAVDVKEISLDAISDKSLLARATLHLCDVSSHAQVHICAVEILKIHGNIDGLFNIAGIAQPFVDFKDMDSQHMSRVMGVNYCGTLYMIEAFLPTLLTRPCAHILNVSSTGGLVPVPGQAIYGASKAAIALLTECLNVELKETNVNVTLAIPGSIDTAIMTFSEETNERTRKVLAQRQKIKMVSAQACAKIMCDAMVQQKSRILIGKDAYLIDVLLRLMPKITRAMMANMLK